MKKIHTKYLEHNLKHTKHKHKKGIKLKSKKKGKVCLICETQICMYFHNLGNHVVQSPYIRLLHTYLMIQIME